MKRKCNPSERMIREYRPDDLETVLAVWEKASAVAHPFLTHEFMSTERHDIVHLHLPTAETWVWEAGGRVVGLISLMGNEVGGLFVDPAVHHQGVGRALLEHAQELRGDLEVEVFEDNALGRAFYGACGFVQLSEGIHEDTGLGVVRLRSSTPGRASRPADAQP